MRADPGTVTLDTLCLPRYKLKRGASRAFSFARGSTALASSANQMVGYVLLVLFSPMIAAMAVMLLAIGIPVVIIMALFPAGRRKIRAQRYKWKNPLRLEADREFVAPGESSECVLLVANVGTLERIAIHIVCEERASYTRGTDRYTDKHRVYDQQLFVMDLTHELVKPYVDRNRTGDWVFTVTVPETAMHSLNAKNNVVAWILEVKRQYPNAAAVVDEFGIMVYPVGVCEAVLRGGLAGPAADGAASAARRRVEGGLG